MESNGMHKPADRQTDRQQTEATNLMIFSLSLGKQCPNLCGLLVLYGMCCAAHCALCKVIDSSECLASFGSVFKFNVFIHLQ